VIYRLNRWTILEGFGVVNGAQLGRTTCQTHILVIAECHIHIPMLVYAVDGDDR
jgi:hypothetical protein